MPVRTIFKEFANRRADLLVNGKKAVLGPFRASEWEAFGQASKPVGSVMCVGPRLITVRGRESPAGKNVAEPYSVFRFGREPCQP